MTQSDKGLPEAVRRVFTEADQARFAALSGDHNPMHLDPVAARRTLAAVPVVHGMHLLIWALDAFAASEGELPPVTALRANFSKFVPVGEEVSLVVGKRKPSSVQLKIVAGGTTRSDVTVQFGAVTNEQEPLLPADLPLVEAPSSALLFKAEDGDCRGLLPFVGDLAEYAAAFPDAAQWIGVERLAALGASTLLVGMICPGLHSIYAGLRIMLFRDVAPSHGLRFETGPVEHGLITSTIEGGGIRGTVEALVRNPPTAQPSYAELIGTIPGDAFSGSHVLIVGGSRGLGELTAKLIAAGGGHVIITWRVGNAEAEVVAAEIIAGGGRCATLPYDVFADAEPQISTLDEAPTHAYYFAAPSIARPNSIFFDAARLRDLQHVFIDGFWSLAKALQGRREDVRLFYPSTTFITDRPKGMAEYAMAKAAGEILCAEMNATMAPLAVIAGRLPRLLTDQTAGTVPKGSGPSVAALLPLILQVQNVAAAQPE